MEGSRNNCQLPIAITVLGCSAVVKESPFINHYQAINCIHSGASGMSLPCYAVACTRGRSKIASATAL
jgi:hypothetical protein